MKKVLTAGLLTLVILLGGCSTSPSSNAQESSGNNSSNDVSSVDLIQETQETLAPYLAILGKESEDGAVGLPQEAIDTINAVKIMDRTGTVSHGMPDFISTQVSIMQWIDNSEATEQEFDSFLESLRLYFGKPEEGVEDYDTMSEETHVWVDYNNSSYVACWYDAGVITVEWHYDESISNSEIDNTPDTENDNTVAFTNKYGTPTTVCAHTGCTKYIAPSGDTNCCTIHSNQCMDCGCYIDEDATWCVSCLQKAAEQAAQTNKHYCEVCGKEATFSIDGITGSKEYYCSTHYNEMKDMLDWMQGN